MEFLFGILPAVLTPVAISVIIPWINKKTKKEEAEDGFITRTKFPSRHTLFAIIALIVTVTVFLIGTVLLAVFGKDIPAYVWIAFGCFALFCISLPFMLTLLALRTYEIVCDDGIVVQRLFRRKFIHYSEIASYHYSFNQLTVYNKEHKPILGVYDDRVGMKALLNQLDSRGVVRE